MLAACEGMGEWGRSVRWLAGGGVMGMVWRRSTRTARVRVRYDSARRVPCRPGGLHCYTRAVWHGVEVARSDGHVVVCSWTAYGV